MKKKASLSSAILILVMVTIFILGCQAASQAAPAATSAPTTNALTPASPPTEAFTPTVVAEVDISSAVLTLEDFPAGFEQLSLEELGMSVSDFSSEGFQPEHVFVFFNSQNFQMIFGFNFLLDETFDRVSFDLGVSKPEVTIPAFVEGMGTENVRDQKVLQGIEDIGERQIGMTMVAAMENIPMQVDVLMFRRDVIGAMVISLTMEGQTPNISIHELGSKLDQRLQDTLQTAK